MSQSYCTTMVVPLTTCGVLSRNTRVKFETVCNRIGNICGDIPVAAGSEDFQ